MSQIPKKITRGKNPLYVRQLSDGLWTICGEDGKPSRAKYGSEKDAIDSAILSCMTGKTDERSKWLLRDAYQLAGYNMSSWD